MIFFVILLLFLIIVGCIVLYRTFNERKQLGILVGERIYVDTDETPGKLLYAKTIPLIGKPDYIRKEKNILFPVERKSGKTPEKEPYLNHTMQLMAYCFLIEENFSRPPGGYISYPKKEYKVAYTNEAKESVRQLVNEIQQCKKANTEFFCKHPHHNF